MAAKRISITDELAVKRISLIAVAEGKDPNELATEAANLLWEQRGQKALEDVNKLSPLVGHLPKEDGRESNLEEN